MNVEQLLNDKVKALATISKDIALREEIEKILSKETQYLKNQNHWWGEYYEGEVKRLKNRLNKEAKRLAKGRVISVKDIIMYMSLDRGLYTKMKLAHNALSVKEILLSGMKENLESTPMSRFISPKTFSEIYNKEDKQRMDFIEENIELFPESSQIYLKDKIQIKENRPALGALTNAFAQKSFENKLEDVPDLIKLNTAYKKFNKIRDKQEKVMSNIYFCVAVEKKYKDNEDKEMKAFKVKVRKKMIDIFVNALSYGRASTSEGQKNLKKMIAPIKYEEDILVKIIKSKKINQYDQRMINNFFLWVSTSKKLEKAINERVEEELNQLNTFSFNYRTASEHVKQAILNDVKEQFIKDEGHFYWLKEIQDSKATA